MYCCTSARWTTAPQSGSTDTSSGRTRAATRRSPSTSRRAVGDRSTCQVVVRAEDDPADLEKPRGKQDWLRDPHSIWYPRTVGHLADGLARARARDVDRADPVDAESRAMGDRLQRLVRRTPRRRAAAARHADRWRDAPRRRRLLGHQQRHAPPHRAVRSRHRRLAQRAAVEPGPAAVDRRRAAARRPGRQGHRPGPQLHRAARRRGRRQPPRPEWPAVSAAAGARSGLLARERARPRRTTRRLRRDVELAKAMGFNGVRKHQKIEDPRYLYWADHLGLLVWEEMPSAYRFTIDSIQRTTREWMDVIRRDDSHPCIIAWVPFNESWGVPEPAQQRRRAPLRPRALPPDEDARPDPAGHRQ